MADDEKRPQAVRFHYIKAPSFQTVHADGVIRELAVDIMVDLDAAQHIAG